MTIDPAHYDGRRHTVTCPTGAEYASTWQAYRDDGFFCQTPTCDGTTAQFVVCKPMPGEDW